MAERICHHCQEVVEEGAPHDCWTTTERALTQELSEDLRDAWERLRETAAEFGEQRIYASHHCIMFSRKAAYFFVRPKRSALEVVVFLGRAIKAPQVRRAERTSQTKIAHIIHLTHRDQVEAPITDWLREAFESSDLLSARPKKTSGRASPTPGARKSATRAPARSKKRPRRPTARKRAIRR